MTIGEFVTPYKRNLWTETIRIDRFYTFNVIRKVVKELRDNGVRIHLKMIKTTVNLS